MAPADWIRARLWPFGTGVGSVVPEGFEAYGRLFHPFPNGDGWSAVAARNGRIAHAEMQLHKIVTDDEDTDAIANGWLPLPQRSILADILKAHTTTPDRCWFAVWEGFGGMDHQGVSARVRLPAREYLLTHGPIEDVRRSFLDTPWDQSPNLWWPDDRAWFVATEIDFWWTYVGARRAVIDQLLLHPALEVLPANLSDDPTYAGDRLNP